MNSMFRLTVAGIANLAIAFLHVVIPVTGVTGYIYFGTNQLALLESQGSFLPDLITWGLALVFAVFGLYCLSGAELIRPLPFTTPVLWFIGGIYTLRGLILFLDLQRWLSGIIYPMRETAFSAVALTIGVMVLIGTWQKYRNSKPSAM